MSVPPGMLPGGSRLSMPLDLQSPESRGADPLAASKGAFGDREVLVSTTGTPSFATGAQAAPAAVRSPGLPLAGRVRLAPPAQGASGAAALRREALPTSTALKKTAGEPKRDWTLFGIKRSTGYKEVLTRLDLFHAAAKTGDTPPPRGADAPGRAAHIGRQLDALADASREVADATDAYDKGNSSRGRRGDMATLGTAARAQQSDVAALRAEMAATGWPEGVSLSDARALRATTTPPMSLAAIGSALQGLREAVADDTARARVVEKMVDHPGLSWQSARHAIAQGTPAGTLDRYVRMGVPVSPETTGSGFGDATLVAPLKVLGAGAFNTVFKGQYRMAEGPPFTGVFKPASQGGADFAEAATTSGIPADNPRFEMRNVAVSRLDSHLGLNVTPRVGLATHKIGGEDTVGLVMEFAKGQSPLVLGDFSMPLRPAEARVLRENPGMLADLAAEKGWMGAALEPGTDRLLVTNSRLFDPSDPAAGSHAKDTVVAFDFGNATIREKVTDLQWLDALAGQVDRHGHNYLVQTGADGRPSGVVGIDNDLAFGDRLLHGNDVASSVFAEKYIAGGVGLTGFHGCKMPEVISAGTAARFKATTPEDLDRMLGDALKPSEVAAAKSRLVSIQAHIARLETEGGVVAATADWASPGVGVRLGVEDLSALRAQPATPGTKAEIARREESAFDASYLSRAAVFADMERAKANPSLLAPQDFG